MALWFPEFRTVLTSYTVETDRPTDMRKQATQTYCCSVAGWPNHKPKRVYRISSESIVNVVADYNNRTFVEILRGIAHNLQL